MINLNDGSSESIIDIETQKQMMGWGENLTLTKAANDSSAFKSRKDDYKEELSRIGGCEKYKPCDICFKCLNKASHLYHKCQICRIPICVHTDANRAAMIKRKNFEIKPTNELKEILLKLSNENK